MMRLPLLHSSVRTMSSTTPRPSWCHPFLQSPLPLTPSNGQPWSHTGPWPWHGIALCCLPSQVYAPLGPTKTSSMRNWVPNQLWHKWQCCHLRRCCTWHSHGLLSELFPHLRFILVDPIDFVCGPIEVVVIILAIMVVAIMVMNIIVAGMKMMRAIIIVIEIHCCSLVIFIVMHATKQWLWKIWRCRLVGTRFSTRDTPC